LNRKKYEFFFVILNYMSSELTIKLIKNIFHCITGYKEYGILIVDNSSPDDSYEVLAKHFQNFENVFVIRNKKNEGYARGNNFGIKYVETNFTECKYVAIVNPDVAFFENTDLTKILDKLDGNPKLAAITAVHLLNGDFDLRTIAWKVPKGIDDLFLNFAVTSLTLNRTHYKKFRIQSNMLSYVEVLPGSFFIIKLDVLRKVGYFDENTFLYCEERILAKRLMEAGYEQAVDFGIFFLHNHHKSKSTINQKIKHSGYLLASRVYYNIAYNKPIGWLVALLLYIFYPLRLLEILIITLFKKVKN